MPTYIVLLRAVNVGGTGKLPMAEFRKLLATLGYRNVETYIQSGNAVLDAPGSAVSVAKSIAAGLEKMLGASVGVLLRTHAGLDQVIAANPFAAESAEDGARVHVAFLSGPPADGADSALAQIVQKFPHRRDRYHLAGETLYLHLPDGAADSKFTPKALERALGVPGTARNWNTVVKLHAISAR